jgi:Arc/MetJ family transcription regulator
MGRPLSDFTGHAAGFRSMAGRRSNGSPALTIRALTRGVSQVYDWCMSRTNIDLDDELTAEVMRRFGVTTKKAAVDLALRRLVGAPLSRDFLLSLEGVGWEGDLENLRSERPDEFE